MTSPTALEALALREKDDTSLPADKVAEVAGKLSVAQRESLLAMPETGQFKPRTYIRAIATWANLKARGLLRSIDGAYGCDAPSCLTSKGRLIRAHLQQKGEQ